MKKNSYKKGPRFGPDMIRHEQSIPTTTIENNTLTIQETSDVEEKKVIVVENPEVVEVSSSANIQELKQPEEITLVVEPVVEKQRETTKPVPERRKR